MNDARAFHNTLPMLTDVVFLKRFRVCGWLQLNKLTEIKKESKQ